MKKINKGQIIPLFLIIIIFIILWIHQAGIAEKAVQKNYASELRADSLESKLSVVQDSLQNCRKSHIKSAVLGFKLEAEEKASDLEIHPYSRYNKYHRNLVVEPYID